MLKYFSFWGTSCPYLLQGLFAPESHWGTSVPTRPSTFDRPAKIYQMQHWCYVTTANSEVRSIMAMLPIRSISNVYRRDYIGCRCVQARCAFCVRRTCFHRTVCHSTALASSPRPVGQPRDGNVCRCTRQQPVTQCRRHDSWFSLMSWRYTS